MLLRRTLLQAPWRANTSGIINNKLGQRTASNPIDACRKTKKCWRTLSKQSDLSKEPYGIIWEPTLIGEPSAVRILRFFLRKPERQSLDLPLTSRHLRAPTLMLEYNRPNFALP